MIDLINRISGNIRHSYRFKQLSHICSALCIKTLPPNILHNKHRWFLGFFDSNGTITLYLKGEYKIPQLTISVTNKLLIDVIHFHPIFGGSVYYDRYKNGYYKWSNQKMISWTSWNILKFVLVNLLNVRDYLWLTVILNC